MIGSVHRAERLQSRSVGQADEVVVDSSPPSETSTRTALTWILRRKGILLDSVCRFRQYERELAHEVIRRAYVETFRGVAGIAALLSLASAGLALLLEPRRGASVAGPDSARRAR